MRILICDSDRDIVQPAADYLRWQGHTVDLTEDSSSVSASLEALAYDLLICDSWCGPLPALSLCRRIRQSAVPEVRNLPLLILVTEAPSHELFKVFRKESIHCLLKYRGPSHWLEKISTLLKKEPV